MMKKPGFLHVDTYRFIEIKSWLKNIGVSVVRNWCGHSVLRTQKLTISREAISAINWFVDRNLGNLKVSLIMFLAFTNINVHPQWFYVL